MELVGDVESDTWEYRDKQGWKLLELFYLNRRGLAKKKQQRKRKIRGRNKKTKQNKNAWTFNDRALCKVFSNFSDRIYRGWRGSLFTGPFTSKGNPGRNKNCDTGAAQESLSPLFLIRVLYLQFHRNFCNTVEHTAGKEGERRGEDRRERGWKRRSFAFHSTNWKKLRLPAR